MFDVAYDEKVIVNDIEISSLCEHCFLPFCGKVQVGHIPQGKVIGLSEAPRLVTYSRFEVADPLYWCSVPERT